MNLLPISQSKRIDVFKYITARGCETTMDRKLMSLRITLMTMFAAVHESSFRCSANVWTLFEVKRTCREDGQHVHATQLTQSGHGPDRNVAAQQSPTVAEVCYPFCRKHGRYRAVKRREFIALLGGAATWPLAARAQQSERMRRIGVLMNVAEESDQQANLAVFVQALQQLGWINGRNVQIETRWAGGSAAEIRRHAGELVALAPDVIFATGTASMGPFLQATRSLPIVFVNVADPVGAGFVDSLSHPGGNATGFIQFEYSLSGKWVELLKQIAPGVTRAAVVRD